MRTVKNAAELRTLALSKGGAIIHGDGRHFNADKQTAQVQPKPKPIPKPEAPPKPDMVEVVLKQTALMAEEQQRMGEEQQRLSKALGQALMTLAEQRAEPVREWVFDIVRDKKDRLQQVIARARED